MGRDLVHRTPHNQDARLADSGLARLLPQVHASRYAGAGRRGLAFPAKAGEWPVNGGFW
jgi:hypothetical protein